MPQEATRMPDLGKSNRSGDSTSFGFDSSLHADWPNARKSGGIPGFPSSRARALPMARATPFFVRFNPEPGRFANSCQVQDRVISPDHCQAVTVIGGDPHPAFGHPLPRGEGTLLAPSPLGRGWGEGIDLPYGPCDPDLAHGQAGRTFPRFPEGKSAPERAGVERRRTSASRGWAGRLRGYLEFGSSAFSRSSSDEALRVSPSRALSWRPTRASLGLLRSRTRFM
jgi:hypothetical protein